MDTIVEGDTRATRVPACSMQVIRAGAARLVIPVVELRTARFFKGIRAADQTEAAPQIRAASSA